MADDIISAFSEEDAERLTGVTVRQLRYWDRTRFFVPSLADENRRQASSRIYTFRDVVCLKILNTIRNESKVPLQHLREVKEKLEHLGEDVWAKTTLYLLNRRVIFMLLSLVPQVVSTHRGLMIEGVATLRGVGIRYRAVLLPLSEAGATIDHVLGATNYRPLHTNEALTTQVHFRRLPMAPRNASNRQRRPS